MNRNTTIFASSFVLSISLVVSSVVISNAVSTPTIKACAAKKTGDLRMITGKAKCKKSEQLVSWGAKGPTGARGPAGAPAIPNVTTVNNFGQSWVNIYVAAGGYNTISLVESSQLPAGDYLVLANLEIYPNGDPAFCSVTTTPEAVGGIGTIHFATNIPTGFGSQDLSFNSNVSVEAGQQIHLRCAGSNSGAQASAASMTLIPVN
jgi:hypothetical protein